MVAKKYIGKDDLLSVLFHSKRLFFVLSIICTMISYLAHLLGYSYVSLSGIVVVMLLCLVGCICAAFGYKKIDKEIVMQMFGIYFIFTLLWDLAIFSPYSCKDHMFIIILGCITLNFSTIFWLFCFIGNENILLGIYKWCRKNIHCLFLICIFVSLCIEVIDDWIKVDSYAYYEYISNAKAWDFTFEKFRLLQYCTHNSFGFSLFSLIGEYFWPNNGYGVKVIQIIMGCMSIIAFSKIIEELQIDFQDKKENFLVTAVFAFMPLYMGILYEINLDFPTACFFIWFVYSYLTGKKIFELASAFLLVFCKETGILLLLGFSLGWIVPIICSSIRKKDLKTLINKQVIFRGISYLLPAIFYVLVFMLSDRWNRDEGSVNIALDGETLFKFGLNKYNILTKMKELFVLNFIWVIVLIGLLLILKNIFLNRKWILKNEYFKKIREPLIGGFIVFLSFNLFYIAHCPARYILPGCVIICIFFAYIVSETIKKEKVRKTIYSTVALLFLVENFFTIDPLTLELFQNISIGKGNIITTRTFVTNENKKIVTEDAEISSHALANSASYNRQYTYLGNLIERFLKKIDYADDTLILLAPIYGEDHITKLSLFGKWKSDDLYYYDLDTGHVVLDANKTLLNLQVMSTDAGKEFDKYNKVYLVYFPYREQYFKIDPLIQDLEIMNQFDVEYRQWVLEAYQLK